MRRPMRQAHDELRPSTNTLCYTLPPPALQTARLYKFTEQLRKRRMQPDIDRWAIRR